MCSVAETRRCVFYRTLAIDPGSRFGSALRPAKLLAAFRELGYEVDVVAGSAPERKAMIRQVEDRIRSGVRYEFLYAEPPTTPIPLNESHHLPTHPLLDYRFLAFAHRHMPVYLFYSDVQWRLEGYRQQVGWPRYLAMLPFFHLDLFVFDRVADVVLVPDEGMLARVGPLARKPARVSIPGYDPAEALAPRATGDSGGPLRLFYVGGVEPPVYDLTPVLRGSARAIELGLDHRLTICCRAREWQRRPSRYDPYLGPQVTVTHNRDRRELLDLYSRHDIAVMPYGTLNADWAMPIKFPEAIGMGLPVLAGRGTAVARMVDQQGIGWSVGDAGDSLHSLLARIDAAELQRARAAVTAVQPRYTWQERAREIAGLTQVQVA